MNEELTAIDVLLARAERDTRSADLLEQSAIEYEAKILEYRAAASASRQLAAACLVAVEVLRVPPA